MSVVRNGYKLIALCPPAYKVFILLTYEIRAKSRLWRVDWTMAVVGTVIAKETLRTRRVDKGKSGQALKTAVSGGFGGGILSQNLEASV